MRKGAQVEQPEKEPSEAPEIEEEERDEFKEESALLERWFADREEIVHQLQEEMELFAEQPKELESESPHLFRAHRRFIRDPLEAYRTADGHEQLQAREDAVQKVLDRNGAYSEEVGYSGSEQARWNCRAYLAIMDVFLLTGVGVGLCFEVWIRQSARKSDAGVLLPQHVEDALRDVADQRRDDDDKTFWGREVVAAEQVPMA